MDVKLVMFNKDGQRKEFPIAEGTTILGRGENCDLRAPLANISRRHCQLTVTPDSIKAKDLASSNGTYVNNKRVNEVDLKAGDRLVVGPVVFTVQVDGQPEEIYPVKTRGQLMAEAGEAGAEEIVDLEADVIAQPGASSAGAMAALAGADEEQEEIDPIAALEAMAAESDEEKEE